MGREQKTCSEYFNTSQGEEVSPDLSVLGNRWLDKARRCTEHPAREAILEFLTEWIALQLPGVDAEGKPRAGYSFQFWLPADYDKEFMASGAFGQYLWIDRKQEFVVAQFSTGQSMLFRGGEAGASLQEFGQSCAQWVNSLRSDGPSVRSPRC
jgi:CubicO group peptidase (beta-lactamase class C family)